MLGLGPLTYPQVLQNLPDHLPILDTGDHIRTAAG